MSATRPGLWAMLVIAGGVATAAAWIAPTQALALTADPQKMYAVTTRAEPDAEAGGWWINLGVTGARGRMMPDAPSVMEVMHVFADTPAAGKLLVGDKIVGVDGKPFAPHKFGYGMDKFGYEGAMMDIGNALEAAQGPARAGKITFDVMRGDKSVAVELNVGTKYGRFTRDYPFDCDKSKRILAEMYAYLLRRQGSNGLWSGRPHINAFAALALLASPEPAHRAAATRAVQQMAKQTGPTIGMGGLPNWQYSLYGIVLAEYYLATGELWVLPELIEVRDALLGSQLMEGPKRVGGWGHRPGFEGYGPIGIITAQAHAALGLMMQCGLEVDADHYRAAHEFLVRGTNKIGYVWYADGGASNGKYADMGRTGAAAVSHFVSPTGGSVYAAYAALAANCIGTNYKTFPDTHASPLLGMGWTALGAATSPDAFRSLMDQHVWFFNLSHNPDGTFYYQPNRDGNPQDYGGDPRLSATATTALIFAVRYRSLRMMGASLRIDGVSKPQLSPTMRKAFEMIEAGNTALAHRTLTAGLPALERDAPTKEQAAADLKAAQAMLAHIDNRLAHVIELLTAKMQGPDVFDLKQSADHYRTTWRGVEAFDEQDRRITAHLREPASRKEYAAGLAYQRLLETVGRRPDDAAIHRLRTFADRFADSHYGAQATKLADTLAGSTDAARKAHFDELLKNTPR